jgi:hypothetical protein
MTIDTTLPSPPRPARPRRSRRTPARWRNRRRLLLPRRKVNRAPLPLADAALHVLMNDADIYKIGRRHYLVAEVSNELMDTLMAAAGATEDDEPNGDLEPSIPSHSVYTDDLEGDELEDSNGVGGVAGRESALGWANEGNQARLTGADHEDEPSLGWVNTGPQKRLAAGYSGGITREADGLERGESDELEVEDDGLETMNEGSDVPLTEADIDAQRGRIASRWPVMGAGR